MKILVTDDAGNTLWERNGSAGMTCRSYAADDTLSQVVTALGDAVAQARFELRAFQVADVVPNVGGSAAEV